MTTTMIDLMGMFDEFEEAVNNDPSYQAGVMGITPDEYPEVDQAKVFKIDNGELADWAMEKLHDIRRQQEAIEEESRIRAERIAVWAKKELDTLSNKASFFEGHLQQYGMTTGKKTVNLVNGKLQFRTLPQGFVHDDEKLLEMAKATEQKELIKIKESFNWAAYKGRLGVRDNGEVVDKMTGEVVEMVKAVPLVTIFTVKFNTPSVGSGVSDGLNGTDKGESNE